MRWFLLVFVCLVLKSIKAQTSFPYERFSDWQSVNATLLADSLYQILDLATLNLDASGQQDCSAPINALLQQFPDDTVRLHFPAGTFLFTQPLQLKSLLIIEGEGPDLTHFRFSLGGSQSAIQANGLLSSIQQEVLPPLQNDLFLICSGHNFQPKDWLYLRCQDAALVTSSWALGTVGQLLQIESIAGDTLYLNAKIRRSYLNELPCVVQRFTPKEHIKLRCFSIERSDDTAPEQSSSIEFNFVVNSQISSLYSRYCTFAHVALNSCSNILVSKNYLTDTSFAYVTCPDFVAQSMWLKIGEQPVISYPIPAQSRYETQSYFSSSCGNTDAGLFENTLSTIVYPNPAQDFATFCFSKPVFGKITIYAIDGKIMQVEDLNSKTFTISLNSMPSGLYLWQIEGVSCAGKLIVR
jgi:hypothetical protein